MTKADLNRIELKVGDVFTDEVARISANELRGGNFTIDECADQAVDNVNVALLHMINAFARQIGK